MGLFDDFNKFAESLSPQAGMGLLETGRSLLGGKAPIDAISRGLQTYKANQGGGILSDEEVQKLGLPKGTVVYMNPNGTPTILNRPADPPSAFDDAKFNNLQLENLRLANEIQKTKDEDFAKFIGERKRLDSQGATVQTTLNSIQGAIDILNRVDKNEDETFLDKLIPDATTGLISGIASLRPGAARDLKNILDSIKSRTAIQELLTSKAQGATYGALNEQEFKALQNAVAVLDQGGTPEQLRKNLITIGDSFKKNYEFETDEFSSLYANELFDDGGVYESKILDFDPNSQENQKFADNDLKFDEFERKYRSGDIQGAYEFLGDIFNQNDNNMNSFRENQKETFQLFIDFYKQFNPTN